MSGMYELTEICGQVVGLHGVREIKRNKFQLRVGQALLSVRIEKQLKQGFMFLWNSEADKVRELKLGNVYRFLALVKEWKNCFLIFFLPKYTKIELVHDYQIKEGI